MPAVYMRYNQSTHIFEYSTSGDDSGPWLALPLDASVLNEGTLDNAVLDAVPLSKIDESDRVGCRVRKSGTQTLTTNVEAAVTWNLEDFVNGSCHETVTNPSRFTAPSDGIYSLQGSVGIPANTGAYVWGSIYKNGSTATIYGRTIISPMSAQIVVFSIFTMVELVAGDYLEIYAFQVSGGNLNLSAGQMSAHFLKVG